MCDYNFASRWCACVPLWCVTAPIENVTVVEDFLGADDMPQVLTMFSTIDWLYKNHKLHEKQSVWYNVTISMFRDIVINSLCLWYGLDRWMD